MIKRTHLGLAATVVGTALVIASGPVQAAPGDKLTPGQRDALAAGVQVAPKGSAGAKSGAVLPNPYLAEVPDATQADYSTWRDRMAAAGKARAKSSKLTANKLQAAGAKAAATALVHDEEEPAGTSGSNDSVANAEPITGFGTGKKQSSKLRILGEMPNLAPAPSALAPIAEDNGSIPLAGNSGINGLGARTTTGVLGDGPHGRAGDATNDFDFYAVTTTAGRTITVSTNGSGQTDTVVAIYSATGERLATDDDSGDGFNSYLEFPVPANGTYYVMVAGYSIAGPFPRDPMDSASGNGGAIEGNYNLMLRAASVDRDFYSFELKPGDVIGGTLTGASNALTIYRPDGTQMVGSNRLDASSLYPPNSPLPGGGNTTMAYVAEDAGSYVLELGAGVGSYDVTVEAYRPGSETDTASRVQTIFLDFDGARVNTGIWGGPGVRDLSPFSAFIAKWGLTRSQEAELIDRITAEVKENLKKDAKAVNPDVQLKVVNSKDHKDIFGKENVARVIVGGTIAQSGIATIGIAQYIDPGNYGHEDSAVVLLDTLSDPSGAASLNTYLNDSSDRVAFVSQAVGNVVSHEIGHLIGNYHTNNTNAVHGLMDAGGTGFANLFGVGPDNVGGTDDDEDVDFALDQYVPSEGFTGLENTLNVAAWAHTAKK